jgi:hypothetical protein
MGRCQTAVYLGCTANGCSVWSTPEDGRKLRKHVARSWVSIKTQRINFDENSGFCLGFVGDREACVLHSVIHEPEIFFTAGATCQCKEPWCWGQWRNIWREITATVLTFISASFPVWLLVLPNYQEIKWNLFIRINRYMIFFSVPSFQTGFLWTRIFTSA